MTNRLYRNDKRGRFIETTSAAGLKKTGWGQGVCAGDYDGDGFVDLFVTYWGQNVLYRNVRGQRFEDVTAKSSLLQNRVRYNTGCAFLDADLDGDLDLVVANYLKFDFAGSARSPGTTRTVGIAEFLSIAGLEGCRLIAICCTAITVTARSQMFLKSRVSLNLRVTTHWAS